MENLDRDVNASESQNTEKARGKKDIESSAKLKLLLNAPATHNLTKFQNELKTRGIKNVDLSELVVEALAAVPDLWWTSKIEALTPLEYRVNTALSDPQLREKLSELLAPRNAADPALN